MAHLVEMVLNTLACVRLDKVEPGKPSFQVFYHRSETKIVPGTQKEFEEVTLGKLKSFVEVPVGPNVRVRVKMGAYVNGSQAETYGHILEVIGGNKSSPSASKP